MGQLSDTFSHHSSTNKQPSTSPGSSLHCHAHPLQHRSQPSTKSEQLPHVTAKRPNKELSLMSIMRPTSQGPLQSACLVLHLAPTLLACAGFPFGLSHHAPSLLCPFLYCRVLPILSWPAGNLTMKLLERAKKVIAIELDPRMVSLAVVQCVCAVHSSFLGGG